MAILESFDLAGKNAVLTGSLAGLGAGIAVALAEAGADVVLHGRNSRGLEQLESAIRSTGRKVSHFLVIFPNRRSVKNSWHLQSANWDAWTFW